MPDPKLREEPPLPEGYESWSPRMGRGGKIAAWIILAMIVAGSVLMLWKGLRPLLG
ncbi:MAG: hypothetical protein AAFX76_12260 [Planctomycetota bacterium]